MTTSRFTSVSRTAQGLPEAREGDWEDITVIVEDVLNKLRKLKSKNGSIVGLGG